MRERFTRPFRWANKILRQDAFGPTISCSHFESLAEALTRHACRKLYPSARQPQVIKIMLVSQHDELLMFVAHPSGSSPVFALLLTTLKGSTQVDDLGCLHTHSLWLSCLQLARFN
jgi:hypothetical protein